MNLQIDEIDKIRSLYNSFGLFYREAGSHKPLARVKLIHFLWVFFQLQTYTIVIIYHFTYSNLIHLDIRLYNITTQI